MQKSVHVHGYLYENHIHFYGLSTSLEMATCNEHAGDMKSIDSESTWWIIPQYPNDRKVVLHTMSQCNLSYLSSFLTKDFRKALSFKRTDHLHHRGIVRWLSAFFKTCCYFIQSICRGDRSARLVQSWSNPNCFPTSTHNDEQLIVRKAFEQLSNGYWTFIGWCIGRCIGPGEQTARPYIQVVCSCLPKKIPEKLCRSQTIV